MPPKITSRTALFRFSVVSEVRVRVARGQLHPEAVQETAALVHIGPDGKPRKVGLRSIYRWLAAYEADGLDGLVDKSRSPSDGVLEPALVQFLVDQKVVDPRASVPQLLRLAATAGLIPSADGVDRTTAWRALKVHPRPGQVRLEGTGF